MPEAGDARAGAPRRAAAATHPQLLEYLRVCLQAGGASSWTARNLFVGLPDNRQQVRCGALQPNKESTPAFSPRVAMLGRMKRQVVVPDATPAQAPGHAHFAGTPAEFQADADLLLQLHGGAHLLAHSALLASVSPVLCKVLKFAASETPAGSKMVLPLTDFTEQEAVDVLTARPWTRPSGAWSGGSVSEEAPVCVHLVGARGVEGGVCSNQT
jgi:hypothetical protein